MLQYIKILNQKEVQQVSEETEIILKLGGLILLLIPLLSFIEPIQEPLKEHLKDVLKIMALISAICLFMAFLSHMELLRPISEFMTSNIFINSMISITTAVPILFMLVVTINEINRKNYKRKLFMFVCVTSVTLIANAMIYVVLINDLVPVAT